MYKHNYDRLTNRNKTSFARIIEFVSSFSRSEVIAENDNTVLDWRGNPVIKPCLIDTHSLVFSKDPLALLGMLDLLIFRLSVNLRFLLTICLCFHV